MRYLRTYELFGFGSKKAKTWQQKFDDIYNFYSKNKDKKDIPILDLPHAEVVDDSFSVAFGIKSHLVFYGQTGKNHNWEVVDFDEADYADPKSTKGVYPISKDEYVKYEAKCKQISDWLDSISEENKNKSSSIVGSGDFELDFDESDIALDEISNEAKKQLPIGEELEFEISYHAWLSSSKNTLVVERRKLKINDFVVGFGGGRFYAEVYTVDPFNQKSKIWIESDTTHEYYDLEENKWPYERNKTIHMSSIEPEMSRQEKREFDKNRRYPYSFSYDLTPSEYKSTEFIKNITELLSELNDQLNTFSLPKFK